jgi:tRNA dimethylallyltransferase
MNTPLLVIVGETGSGKSRLAIALAKLLDGEIICADSWTVRREVNIGTDKPSEADRREVPHHLLDIVGPDEDFTAAVFKGLANQVIVDIYKRGKLPIMVGGSGLYVDSVLYNYGFLEAGNRELRKVLNALSIDELLTTIEKLGLSLNDIDVRNKRRLIRLIETSGQKPTKDSLRSNTLMIGVRYEASELQLRIEGRVDDMLERGIEDEVRRLSANYGWDCEALKGVGYKQWQDYFEGRQSLEETRQRIISATQNLAKKQRTWFKRNKSIHWLNQPVNTDTVVDLMTTELSS